MSAPDRLDAVEDALLRADPHVATAPEIAETLLDETSQLDSVADPRREVYADLRLLERSGVVDSTETGSRSRAWWHIDRVRPPARHDVSEHTPEPEPAVDADHDVDDDPSDVIDDALSDWRPGRSQNERASRRAAGVAVLEWLRDRDDGPVSREDVVRDTYPDLAPDDQSSDTYWRKTARAAFTQAADSGLVDDDGRTYEWLG